MLSGDCPARPDAEIRLWNLRWGLVPYWAKDEKIGFKTINARAETIDTAHSFRSAFRKRRCLTPVDGFYEWKKVIGGKIPYSIEMKDDSPFVFAGLWEGRQNPETKEWLRTKALGPNGQLIVNLVPALELVIGRQPPIPDLPPQDAQNRFQMVFRRFLGVFARKEHPLALFLDDLQWLDAATPDLLEHLVRHSEVQHRLLVGAYRDNEVGPTHPLLRTLEAIRDAGAPVQEIVLAPLWLDDLGRLVADALHCKPECARPLAQLVHEKTGGNPFFAIQFFTALAEEGLLAFDPATPAWQWDNGPNHDASRRVLNAFIRNSVGIFDGIEDFDAATLDPSTGNISAEFLPNSTYSQLPLDYLHPHHAGYIAMGEAVDIGPFAPNRHRRLP